MSCDRSVDPFRLLGDSNSSQIRRCRCPSVRSLFRLAWVPAVGLGTAACLATTNDVRTLQGDIATLRAQAARADSMHRAQLQAVARQVGTVADSLHSLNAFLLRFANDVSRFQGDLTLEMHRFGQQLIAVQELGGQSQKRLQELRARTGRSRPRATVTSPNKTPTRRDRSSTT